MTIRKDYMLIAAAFLLCFVPTVDAQVPWDSSAKIEPIGQAQVTFLEAETAEVASTDEGVMIFAEGLKQSRGYGVLLTAPGKVWLEAHPVDKPFPPLTIVEYDKEKHPGKFMLRGNPGDRFWVSVRGDGPPTWSEVTVAPEAKPDDPEPAPEEPPPPGSFESITKLSSELSAKLNDPLTSGLLKDAVLAMCDTLERECKAGTCPTLPGAKQRVVAAISQALLGRTRPNKDWYSSWRIPMSAAIEKLNAQDPQAYTAVMRAAAKGL